MIASLTPHHDPRVPREGIRGIARNGKKKKCSNVPFLRRLLRLPPLSLSSGWLPFPRESVLSTLSCLFNNGLEVKPLTTGADPRAEGRYSGVFFAEDAGLSNTLLEGVKFLSSRSRRARVTGVKVAGAVLTGVKPPAFTAVKPEVTGAG